MSDTRGFTLIEVLVATAIAAVLMLSLMRGLSLGLDLIGRARSVERAALIAQSTLALLGRAVPLRPGVIADRVGPFQRVVRIARLQAAGAGGLAAYRVQVQVGRDGRVVALDSVRLGP
ncbi:MAG: prepilin-type N-terminal cleavage/methylation domain-containing protein [Acetobacteraceae bacterium]